MSHPRFPLFLLVAILVSTLATQAQAYDSYHPDSPEIGCFSCHPGFDGRGPLHDLHVGNSQMTNSCGLCHTSNGDNPKTWTAGLPEGESCRGCHGVDNGTTFGWGAGLRAHHLNAGAPADANGDICSDCHTDPAPDPESTLPVYYSLAAVNVKLPCNSIAADGEDWDGDGQGLDNDGDLTYDEDDTDCGAQTGVVEALLTPPRALTLLSINPNPVMTSRGTDIVLGTPASTEIKIQVFDILGRPVFTRRVSASEGWQRVHFSGKGDGGRPLPTGIYLVRLVTERETAISRMTVLR